MGEIKIHIEPGAEDYAREVLDRIFAPRTPEQAAADDLRYRQMIYRAYNLLLEKMPERKWNLDIPLPSYFPWEDFVRLNPDAPAALLRLEEEQHYTLSEGQCSKAVMALLSYPDGPKIEFEESPE